MKPQKTKRRDTAQEHDKLEKRVKYIRPVSHLKPRIAVEAVVDARDG